MLARNFDRAGRKIGTGDFRAAPSKLQKISTHATTNLKQPRAGEFIKAHHFGHPRSVLLITMMLDRVKEFARVEFMFPPVDRAARIFTPLFARA